MAFQYPTSIEDLDGILQYARDIRGANRTYWDAVETQGWKAILYFLGIQWITYSSTLRFWRPIGFRKDQPRPVTNLIKPLINDLASKLVGFKPPLSWSPGSDQEADYVAAAIADRVTLAIEREADFRGLKPVAARWLGLTGNVFPVSSYDNSFETGERHIQAYRCEQCGQPAMPRAIEAALGLCPSCGSQEALPGQDPETGLAVLQHLPRPRFGPAVGPGQLGPLEFGPGEPMAIAYPRGQHLLELENIFTVRYDPQAPRFHQTPYVRIARSRDQVWIAEHYGEAFAEQVAYGQGTDPFTGLFDSLALTAVGGGSSTATLSTGEGPRALVERLWLRPHPTRAPEGIYAEIVGDRLAPIGPLDPDTGERAATAIPYPYHDERGRPMLNVAHLEFDQVPGRSLAASRIEDALPIQEDVNELDAFIKLHHRRMANAVWLIPQGSEPTKITGEGGIYIRYNPLASGQRPERAQGILVPSDIYQYREIRKQEIERVFGSYEVSRGQAPRGVEAYAALQMLDERAQQAQSNIFANWGLGWAEVARQQLNIWREYADETRTVSLGFGRWAVKQFNKAQMIGAVDLDLDVGQGRPMTMIAKMARIGQMIQHGVINVGHPKVQHMILRAAGIPEMIPDFNKHYIKAARIVDQMLAAPAPEAMPPPPNAFDNHAIHLEVLESLILDEVYETLEPWRQEIITLRAQVHFEFMQQQMPRLSAGQNAPRAGEGGQGGPDNRGGGGAYTTDEDVLERERQGASPDTFSGVTVGAGNE